VGEFAVYLDLGRVAPAPTRFTQNFCYARASLTVKTFAVGKSKPYGLANLSFRFIDVVGLNYSTT
jgi:hypothetical protein